MLLAVLAKFLVLLTICEAMTLKQLKNTGKMMRKSCQPKVGATDEQIDPLNDGIFKDEREVKCYIACIMKMASTMKNGRPNVESALKQAELLLPEDMKGPGKEAIIACKNAADNYKDSCDACFHITQCVAKYNPSIFFFP